MARPAIGKADLVAKPLLQRRRDLRFPPGPLRNRAVAIEHLRMGCDRDPVQRVARRSPYRLRASLARSGEPAAREFPAHPHHGRDAAADEEAGKIQRATLGRDRPRRHRHQQPLPRAGPSPARLPIGDRRGLARALLSLRERFPHPYHAPPLGGLSRAADRFRAPLERERCAAPAARRLCGARGRRSRPKRMGFSASRAHRSASN